MPVYGLQEGETGGFQTLEKIGAAETHQALAGAAKVLDEFSFCRRSAFFSLRVHVITQSVPGNVQCVDKINYFGGIQPCIAVGRIGIVYGKLD